MKRIALLFGVVLAGCGDNQTGSLTLTISGEQPAITGYPDAESGLAFADGWSLRWSKYLASLGNVRVESADGEVAVEGTDAVILDLHQGDAVAYEFSDLPARRFERVSYDVLAARDGARVLGTVSQEDVATMVQKGLVYLAEGTATKGDRTVVLRWEIAAPTRNADCTAGDGNPGVVIRAGGEARHQLTLHLDHTFYDHLGEHADANMRLDAIAAAAGDDGVVTIDDLAAQDILDLKDDAGQPLTDGTGSRVVYDPFGTPLASQDLRSYVVAASRSAGHFDGEGGCVRQAL